MVVAGFFRDALAMDDKKAIEKFSAACGCRKTDISRLQVKIILPLFIVLLSAACLLTGCQSPKAASAMHSVGTNATPALTNAVPGDRILMIDPSSMPVSAGKATLIIGALHRANGVYTGDYRIKVFPYFTKNEKGTLAIIVSNDSLAGINHGKVVAVTGTATSSGKGGPSRHIDATATPVDINKGNLKLWFMAGALKMTFKPAYHFAGPGTAGNLTKTTGSPP